MIGTEDRTARCYPGDLPTGPGSVGVEGALDRRVPPAAVGAPFPERDRDSRPILAIARPGLQLQPRADAGPGPDEEPVSGDPGAWRPAATGRHAPLKGPAPVEDAATTSQAVFFDPVPLPHRVDVFPGVPEEVLLLPQPERAGPAPQGATSISCSLFLAWARSELAWRRSQNPAFDHPAFSRRMAISGEIAARPFRTRERV